MLSVKDTENWCLSLGGGGGGLCHIGRQDYNSFGALMGQYCQYGLGFTLSFPFTKELSIMYN